VKIGIVGCGYWGPNLVRNALATQRCEVFCYDADPTALTQLLERFSSVTPASGFEELLRLCDAVMIATPVKSHYALAHRALTVGTPVFVEKPLTSSFAQARELFDLAGRLRLPLMTGHTYLYSAAVRKIARYIAEDMLGNVLTVSSSRKNLGIHRSDVNVIWDLAPHDLSILLYALKEAPTRIAATGRACVGDVLDFASLTLQFPSGTVATLKESWLATAKVRRMEIIGTRRMLAYDDTSETQKIRLYDYQASVTVPGAGRSSVDYHTGEVLCPSIEVSEPLLEETHAFLDWVQYGIEPESNQRIALQVVACIEAACRSLQEDGRLIKVAGSSIGLVAAPSAFAPQPVKMTPRGPILLGSEEPELKG
jgi:predicted dehydrogenase